MDISAVINTYNEAEKLSGCLASVKDWVKEIVVVDMGSTDKTLEVAKKFGAKIYQHQFLPYVEPARNFGLRQAQADWFLVLDPDERVGQSLAEKLQEIVQKNEFDAVKIPRKNIIFGRWIKHSNWWPDYHVRFFKKGKVFWTKKIHLYPEVKGRILSLPPEERLAIEHLNYDSVNDFLSRQNRYSEIAAQNRIDEEEKFSFPKFFWRPTRVFVQRYFRHLGFLDGFHGLALAFLASYAALSEEIKIWEKTKPKSS